MNSNREAFYETQPMAEIPAVVLAGGINTIPLFPNHKPGYKALLRYNGKPSVSYVIDALERVPRIGRIAVLGPEEELRPHLSNSSRCEIRPAGSSMADTIQRGLQHFSDFPQVFLTMADLPLISSRAVTDFLNRVCRTEPSHAQSVFVSVVSEQCYTGRYRRVTKGFTRFKDISVCHGNLMVMDTRLRDHQVFIDLLRKIYSARKNSVGILLSVGIRYGLLFLFGVKLVPILTLSRMTQLVSSRLGVGIVPVPIEHPEITVDVDEPEDYTFVMNELAGTNPV